MGIAVVCGVWCVCVCVCVCVRADLAYRATALAHRNGDDEVGVDHFEKVLPQLVRAPEAVPQPLLSAA